MTTIDSAGSPEPGIPFHVRQGDVLVLGVEAIPDDAKPVSPASLRVVLRESPVEIGRAHV